MRRSSPWRPAPESRQSWRRPRRTGARWPETQVAAIGRARELRQPGELSSRRIVGGDVLRGRHAGLSLCDEALMVPDAAARRACRRLERRTSRLQLHRPGIVLPRHTAARCAGCMRTILDLDRHQPGRLDNEVVHRIGRKHRPHARTKLWIVNVRWIRRAERHLVVWALSNRAEDPFHRSVRCVERHNEAARNHV